MVGKRTTGRFFLDQVADGGTENCDYLIACDLDNEPVPGYRFASYDQGYGDMLARPDWSTVRVTPWVERTALVLCDLHEVDTGEPIEVAPRTVLRRQVEAAASLGYLPMVGQRDRVLPVPRHVRRGPRQGLPRSAAALAVARGLPRAADHQGRVRHRRDPSRARGRRRAGRVLQGRGRARPARDQPRLRRGRRDGRPQPRLQDGGEGDRPSARAVGVVHGQVRLRRHRVRVATSTPACGRRTGTRRCSPGTGRST